MTNNVVVEHVTNVVCNIISEMKLPLRCSPQVSKDQSKIYFTVGYIDKRPNWYALKQKLEYADVVVLKYQSRIWSVITVEVPPL